LAFDFCELQDGARHISDASSTITGESATYREDEAQDDAPVSYGGSEAGTITPPLQDKLQSLGEDQAALASERHAQMLSFVHENLQSFSQEIVTLREEFHSMLQRVVSQEVRAPLDAIQQVRLDLEQEVATRCCVQERLEKKMAELDQGLNDDMCNLRDTLQQSTDLFSTAMHLNDDMLATRETGYNEPSSLNVSLVSEMATDKIAALEEKMQNLERNCSLQLEERLAADSAELAPILMDFTEQVQSLRIALEKEEDSRVGGDNENAMQISRASEALRQMLKQERQERQCMCSLVAEASQKRVAVATPENGEKDTALHDALGGVFASVRSLQEALSAEVELRENSFNDIQKLFQSEISTVLEVTKMGGWHVEAKKIWDVLEGHKLHMLDAQLGAKSPRRTFQSASTVNEKSPPRPITSTPRNKKDATTAGVLQARCRSALPNRRPMSAACPTNACNSLHNRRSMSATCPTAARRADSDLLLAAFKSTLH
jgi:hypothetical protein